MEKIMLIEDDITLATQVKEVLESYDYHVSQIKDFHNIVEEFQEIMPKLVLLDINLPYYDGNYICRRIRKISHVPIIIISARDSEIDQVFSMEMGADDYVIKPFQISVLLAKINAVIRRTYGEYSEKNSNIGKVKALSLDFKNFQLCYKDAMRELSKNEFRLMKYFMEHPDCIIEREKLLEELWDKDTFIDDNTLTVNVTRIKGKLKELGISECIKTKRGVGYLFDTRGIEDEGSN